MTCFNNNNPTTVVDDEDDDIYTNFNEFLTLMNNNVTLRSVKPTRTERRELLMEQELKNIPHIVRMKLEPDQKRFLQQYHTLSTFQILREWKLYINNEMRRLYTAVRLIYNQRRQRQHCLKDQEYELLPSKQHLNDCFIIKYCKPFSLGFKSWENVKFFNDPTATSFLSIYNKFSNLRSKVDGLTLSYSYQHDLAHVLIQFINNIIFRHQKVQKKFTDIDQDRTFFAFLFFLTEVYCEFHQPGIGNNRNGEENHYCLYNRCSI